MIEISLCVSLLGAIILAFMAYKDNQRGFDITVGDCILMLFVLVPIINVIYVAIGGYVLIDHYCNLATIKEKYRSFVDTVIVKG